MAMLNYMRKYFFGHSVIMDNLKSIQISKNEKKSLE